MIKRKIFVILICIISCSCFFNISHASNPITVYVTSKQEIVEQQEEIEITVTIENGKITACNFSIYFDTSKVEFISSEENANQGDFMANTNRVDNQILFVWFDSLGGNGAKEGNIATFKFRAKEKGLATFIVEGEFYGQKGELLETDFKESQVQIGKEESNLQKQAENEQGTNLENANCNLQALRLDQEGLVPQFDKEIEEYYLTIPNNRKDIDVLAISENSNAIVEIKGNTNLQEGLNDMTIQVTSEDKTKTKVYTIHVTKTANLALANTNLEILAIENILLNPPFDTFETNYKVEVSQQTESINVLAVPENEQATVQLTGKDDLKEGNNLVTVLVTAPNGFTKKSYVIDVYRRNLAEEEKYQEAQEKQKEELENAYKLKETMAGIKGNQEEVTKAQNRKYQNLRITIIVILILLFVAFGVFWKIRKK